MNACFWGVDKPRLGNGGREGGGNCVPVECALCASARRRDGGVARWRDGGVMRRRDAWKKHFAYVWVMRGFSEYFKAFPLRDN